MMKLEEKRRSERIAMQSLTISIADGSLIYEGVIEDVSTGGFKIGHLPRKFQPDVRQYVSVISGGRENFKFLVQPCWKRNTDTQYQEIGCEIAFPPWRWTEFVRQYLPEQEADDTWGSFV